MAVGRPGEARGRELIKVQLMETPEKSNRQIAAGLGVDHKTVSTTRKLLEAVGEIPQQETIITKDGKARPRKASEKTEKSSRGTETPGRSTKVSVGSTNKDCLKIKPRWPFGLLAPARA